MIFLSKVQIYTTNYCPYCKAAKSLLEKKGYEYEEINLQGDPEKKYKVMTDLNWRTVPIILIDGNLVGGYDQLADLERKKKLDELLN